ncbi:hypothetical protein [Vibrio fluminensis]|uniref:hypothetical protein n=1 Tax=Vibrio fluminensis TaxID=2783614 RepID=UPI0018895599|nr:hypothetical protein [Vibrio fluminensis]
MKSILTVLFACTVSAISTLTYAITSEATTSEQSKKLTIATAIPVVASMLEELTQQTQITVLYVPPNKYSVKRIPGWLKRQTVEAYPSADIVASISSVWSDIDIYPALRSKNIAIIPVDLANALTPGGERVAITKLDDGSIGYFWLNPSNMQMMLGILHRDLQAILAHKHHEDKEQLRLNFAHMSAKLRKQQLELNQHLIDGMFMNIVVDKPELIDLGAVTLVPLASREQAIEDELPTLLITSKKPSHRSLQNLPQNIEVWHVDDFSKYSKGSLTQRWQSMLNKLAKINASTQLQVK